MAAPFSIVVCDDNTRKTYDARVKNKFKWGMVDRERDFLSSDIRKIDADGLAWCCFCQNVHCSELQQQGLF